MQSTGHVHSNEWRNIRRPFTVEMRFEAGTAQRAVACLLDEGVQASSQRQGKSIGAGSDYSDGTAK